MLYQLNKGCIFYCNQFNPDIYLAILFYQLVKKLFYPVGTKERLAVNWLKLVTIKNAAANISEYCLPWC